MLICCMFITESTGDCTGKTDKCVSGAACKTNACACSTKYKENTDKLCATGDFDLRSRRY